MSGNGACVLIVGGAADPEARRVAEAVEKRGKTVVWCDTDAFPGECAISLRDDGAIGIGGRRLPHVQSVYLRTFNCSPLLPALANDLETRPHGLLAQCREKQAVLTSIILALRDKGVRIVNSIEANAQHGNKPYQIMLLQQAGLPAPASLAANDPETVREFVGQVGRAVYKPLAGGATVREVQDEDLYDERLAALVHAPVLFQELVEGVSVRSYVLDGKVVGAAEIRSKELDYRRDEGGVAPTSLNEMEESAARTAARVCRMGFAGVDLIRTRQGFRVLECNPSPMFSVFEKKTGLDIAGPLAESLAA